MAMTKEQQEYERQLNGWTYFLSFVRELIVIGLVYVATKEISWMPSFELVMIVWGGVWVARVIAYFAVRPWAKEHSKACVTFDLKTKDQYIVQLESELENERAQYLELLSECSECHERIQKMKDEKGLYDDLAAVMLHALEMGYEIKALGGEYHFVLPGVLDGRRCVVSDIELENKENLHLLRDMLVTVYHRPRGKRIEHDIRLGTGWQE